MFDHTIWRDDLKVVSSATLEQMEKYIARELGEYIGIDYIGDEYVIRLSTTYGVITTQPVLIFVRNVGFIVPDKYEKFRYIALAIRLILETRYGEYGVGLEEVADAFGQRTPTEVPEIGE